MRERSLPVLLLLLIFSLAPRPSLAGEFDLEKTKQVLESEIRKALEGGIASISIALVRGDEIVWTAAFGYSNYHTKTKATPETIYVTGSTFKAVTATAILQLVERGKCRLDDSINAHLAESRIRDADAVTLRHILSHTSGLKAGANTVPVWHRELPMTLAELTSNLSRVRAPEAKYEYNNYAYGLAGYVIEKITGTSYEEYVVENILKPLGVRTPAPVRPTAEMVERLALPYTPGANGEPKPTAQVRYDVYPAGDIYLTAEDMARFLGAHLNGGAFNGHRILTPDSVKEAHRPILSDYGLGWAVRRNGNHTLISHGGGVPGFITSMVGDVENRVGAYVMSNGGNVTKIAEAAVKLLRGEDYNPPKERVAITVGRETLRRYVGRYELRPDFVIAVTIDGDRLFIQATGQGKLEVFAESPNRFFLKVVDAQIEFLKNAKGEVDRLELSQGGGQHVGKRLE